jgi:hypothetical protein
MRFGNSGKADTIMGAENEVQELQTEHDGTAADKALKDRKKIDPTLYLVALLTVLVLSISYFFVFALPKMKRDQLDWEKERYVQDKKFRESFNKCVDAAEAEYESYIKLNGSPVAEQPGAYSAPEYIWDSAEKNRTAALEDCSRRYQR